MNSIWTVEFWKDAGERVISTGLQALATVILVTGFELDQLLGVELWKIVGTMTLVALAKVVLAGLAGGNPSLTNTLPSATAVKAIEIGQEVLNGRATLAEREVPAVRDVLNPEDLDDDPPKHLLGD